MQNNDREKDAQARLDQIHHQAGGALSGRTLRRRAGLDPHEAHEDPPLDWRPTPLNILLQILALILFVGVVYFLVTAFFGGFSEVLGR